MNFSGLPLGVKIISILLLVSSLFVVLKFTARNTSQTEAIRQIEPDGLENVTEKMFVTATKHVDEKMKDSSTSLDKQLKYINTKQITLAVFTLFLCYGLFTVKPWAPAGIIIRSGLDLACLPILISFLNTLREVFIAGMNKAWQIYGASQQDFSSWNELEDGLRIFMSIFKFILVAGSVIWNVFLIYYFRKASTVESFSQEED